MELIERIWETTDALRELEGSVTEGLSVDRFVLALDRGANFFIF